MANIYSPVKSQLSAINGTVNSSGSQYDLKKSFTNTNQLYRYNGIQYLLNTSFLTALDAVLASSDSELSYGQINFVNRYIDYCNLLSNGGTEHDSLLDNINTFISTITDIETVKETQWAVL